MEAHARYMFDAVFASTAKGQAAEKEIPAHTDEALEAARDAAYQQGLVDGNAQASRDASSQVDRLVTRLMELVKETSEDKVQNRENAKSQATRLALVATRTLVPTLIAREPEGELMALFQECVAQLEGIPQLVIHVPAGLAEDLKSRLENVAANLVGSNEIRVVVDENMADGDCRIAWATGEISRDRRQLEEQIVEIVERRYPPTADPADTNLQAAAQQDIEPETTEIDESPAHEGAPQ